MTLRLRCHCLFALYLCCLNAAVTRAQAQAQPPASVHSPLEAQVDAYVKPYMDLGGFNGAILIAKGGHVLLTKGYGMANYELNVPNAPSIKFHIGSVSKTFTAAAIMMLQEQGKLNVHDPVSKYVPDFPNGDKIKLHHLLTNTSGIPNVNNFPEYARESKFPHTPENLIAMFKNKPLDFEPGSRPYTESNSNYNLLAFIIEKLSGQSYGDFLQQHIFEPLQLNDTRHDGDAAALIPNRAAGYAPAGLTGVENAPYLDWSIKTGNGSIYSTVEDIYRWDRALYTEKILKKNSIAEMFTNEYGWFNGKRLNRNVVRMNGRSPGFNAEIHRYIDDDVFIAVLANTYVPTAGLIATDLARMVFGEKYEPPKLIKPPSLEKSALEALVGRYQFGADFFVPHGIYAIETKDGQLLMRAPGADATLVPQSDTEFFDRPFWSTIVFEKDAQGRATHLIWKFGGTDYRAERLKD